MKARQSSKKKVKNANSLKKEKPPDQISKGTYYENNIFFIENQIKDEAENYFYFLSQRKFAMVESSSRKMQYLRKEIEAIEYAKDNTLFDILKKSEETEKQIKRYTKLIEPLAMYESDTCVFVSTSVRQMNTGVRLFSHYRSLLISYRKALLRCLETSKKS